ncbi:Cleavage and polyadenylation specificity factor subunit 2 [Porphyridium purpureum]|uniref:Cleavage and polyadenylation specificity factor subunit 2 n=1 Tax=Porphyridium purpureum TaxID=35688 RepID=A0A5J4Z843_PORPP|nr:Cleavage and polyadenylation specificity factor subunit 2 [Porphyridium purpureum]|eukprot:POR5335..scf295_1
MSSVVRFTPLYGTGTGAQAVSYLLEIDGFNILVDCGWNDRFDDPAQSIVPALQQVTPKVDAVLISHSGLHHVGALPYAYAKLGLLVPTYCTLPITRMGQLALYDALLSKQAEEPFDLFSLDDVDDVFDRIVQLKFQQHHAMTGKGAGITVTPYSAGHSLGATVWKIKKDTEEVILATDFNHRKEKHLNATALTTLVRPSHLVIGASQMLEKHNPKSDMVAPVEAALRRGCNVLIPTDTAGRIVELALAFDELWTEKKYGKLYSLCVVHSVAYNTFEFARSMIEWMSDAVANKFDETRQNPFTLRQVEICHSLSEVDALPGPKVVLASFTSLETGFARDLFVEWCSNPKALVLFADRLEPNTLAHDVWSKHSDLMAEKDSTMDDDKQQTSSAPLPHDETHIRPAFDVEVVLKRKVALEGAELKEFRDARRQEKKEKQKLERRRHHRKREVSGIDGAPDVAREDGGPAPMMMEELSESESDASLEDIPMAGGNVQMDPAHVLMFPFTEPVKEYDDFGEIIDTARFMIGEDPGGDDDDEDIQAMVRFNQAEHQQQQQQQEEEEQVPSKYVQQNVTLHVACDFALCEQYGVSDGRAIKQIVSSVAPRRLIVVNGTKEENEALREWATSEKGLMLKASEVYVPDAMETINVTSDTSVYRVTLHDSLFVNVDWRQVGDALVAYVTGSLRVEDAEQGMIGIEGSQEQDRGHPTIFLGDLKMPLLKESLMNEGIHSSFAGGCLCIENAQTGAVVVVKKVGSGEVTINGAFCEEYFAVRDILYQQFTTLPDILGA